MIAKGEKCSAITPFGVPPGSWDALPGDASAPKGSQPFLPHHLRVRMNHITSLDATALSAALEAGSVGAAEIMSATLDRIERLNPKVNAIVSMRPRDVLMAEARAAERLPRRGWPHGVPFAAYCSAETV